MAMELNAVNEYVLSSMDVKALKEADHVSMFHRENGQHEIVCIKQLNKPTPWESEKRYFINVHSRIDQHYKERIERKSAFVLVQGYSEEWKTIVDCLKAGDKLTLRFRVDAHTNGYMEKADLHGDILELQVDRQVGKKGKRLTFIVEEQVCPDNSARMIQY